MCMCTYTNVCTRYSRLKEHLNLSAYSTVSQLVATWEKRLTPAPTLYPKLTYWNSLLCCSHLLTLSLHPLLHRCANRTFIRHLSKGFAVTTWAYHLSQHSTPMQKICQGFLSHLHWTARHSFYTSPAHPWPAAPSRPQLRRPRRPWWNQTSGSHRRGWL